ncbi:MAG: PAS domain-containing protein, partial [Pseudomonadota bacterium]
MPETIRTSGANPHLRQGGFLAAGLLAAAGGAWAAPALAEQQPFPVRELVLVAYQRIDQNDIAMLLPLVGLILLAAVCAIALLRMRARAVGRQASARDEIAALREQVDRANALLLSEPQVLVEWPAGSNLPDIDGDPTILGLTVPHRVLAFGSWLDARKARELDHAVEALRACGQTFSMLLTTRSGRSIEALGRAVGGRAVLRLKDASIVTRELAQLGERHEKLRAESASLRRLIETLPSPVWTRDAEGRLTFVNSAYARAVEARDGADVIERRLELLDRAARETIAQAHTASSAYWGRLPAIVAGARRSFDVLDFRTDTGSAGLVIDATEAETMRSVLARMVDAHRRTLDQLSTGVAMFDSDHRLSFYNAAYRALWDLDVAYLDRGPTDSALLEE